MFQRSRLPAALAASCSPADNPRRARSNSPPGDKWANGFGCASCAERWIGDTIDGIVGESAGTTGANRRVPGCGLGEAARTAASSGRHLRDRGLMPPNRPRSGFPPGSSRHRTWDRGRHAWPQPARRTIAAATEGRSEAGRYPIIDAAICDRRVGLRRLPFCPKSLADFYRCISSAWRQERKCQPVHARASRTPVRR